MAFFSILVVLTQNSLTAGLIVEHACISSFEDKVSSANGEMKNPWALQVIKNFHEFLARNLVPWFLDIIVFQFSVTLVYQPPLFSKKKTSKIGFWLYFSNFASLGPILDHLQKTPLKNIILAYLENSLSKIARRKVSSLSCCFFL